MPAAISICGDRGYADRLRDYRVLLDGAEIGRIGNGGQKSFEIGPGHHQLMIKVDWGRSNIIVFDLADGESAQFRGGTSLRGWRLALSLY